MILALTVAMIRTCMIFAYEECRNLCEMRLVQSGRLGGDDWNFRANRSQVPYLVREHLMSVWRKKRKLRYAVGWRDRRRAPLENARDAGAEERARGGDKR